MTDEEKKRAADWIHLQESLASRTSHYLGGIGELIQRRSLEPKEWLTGYSDYWKNVIGDIGDWMLVRDNQKLRPTQDWVRRFSTSIQSMQQGRASIRDIEVPDAAFGDPPLPEITLVTDGLSRGNRRIILFPEKNVHFEQTKITRSEHRSVVIHFSYPGELQPGIYSGIVCADETDLTVAIIELEVR